MDAKERGEGDDEGEHGAREDGGRRRAGAFVRDRAEVHGLVLGRTDRVVNQAFVLRHVRGLIVLHVAHEASRARSRLHGQCPTPLPASRNPRTAVSNRA